MCVYCCVCVCIGLFPHATTELTTSITRGCFVCCVPSSLSIYSERQRQQAGSKQESSRKKLPQNNVIFCQNFLPLTLRSTLAFSVTQKCQLFSALAWEQQRHICEIKQQHGSRKTKLEEEALLENSICILVPLSVHYYFFPRRTYTKVTLNNEIRGCD